jgi:molecular chaperone DnaK (HSP70)
VKLKAGNGGLVMVCKKAVGINLETKNAVVEAIEGEKSTILTNKEVQQTMSSTMVYTKNG